jgi:phosphatidylethanolamine/phosphatidyl-N-methylethanolamine N-methyltransferase
MNEVGLNTTAWNQTRYRAYVPIYDLVTAPLQRGRQRSISLLDVQPGEAILLLGCGTGLDLPLLPPAARISAIDLTPAMVERTAQRGAALRRTVEASVMNGEQLAFADACFDAIVLHLILAVIPDPIACIREAARVLRPGGRVAIFDKFLPDGATPSPLRQVTNLVTSTFFSTINRQLGPLLTAADLAVERQEPVGVGGLFQVVIANKR